MDELLKLAREAGSKGENWHDWTMSDEIQNRIYAVSKLDSRALEAAFNEGWRELRATIWRKAWTTAPKDYDSFGTETIEECGDWYGKTLRCVLIDPTHYTYQTTRYGSGLHPSFDVDPRIEEVKAKKRLAKEKAEREARETKHAEGLVRLRTASDSDLEDFDTFEAHGLRYDDVRAEKVRRATAAAETKRTAEWERCRAIVPDGVTIVDEGWPARRDTFGLIPGRPSHVWHNVNVVTGWPDDAGHATVRSAYDDDDAGSLLLVADSITSGRLKIVPVDSVPPRPVLDRFGHENLRFIRHFVVAGVEVWVYRIHGLEEVLDAKGHIVRAKKIRAAALASFGDSLR